MIIEHLATRGLVDKGVLYESPFTDIAPTGPDKLFSDEELNQLLAQLDAIQATAAALRMDCP